MNQYIKTDKSLALVVHHLERRRHDGGAKYLG